jgi:peptidoglycan/LPS O-acetylase OafA/YrhL
MRLRYHPALDGLRAVAVLAVIAYHDEPSRLPGGFLGVDAFFVLSGFLITSLLLAEYRRTSSIGLVAFWGRRIRRLLPALLLLLLAVSAYSASHLPAIERSQLRGDALSALVYVTNWRFITSGVSYFASVTTPNPLRHLWSLAIEEQFYLVWPFVVLGCLRLGRGRLRVLAVASLAGAAASTFLMAARFRPIDASRSYYGTDTRAHALLVGALLAIVLAHRPVRTTIGRRLVAIGGIAGAAATMAMLFVISGDTRFYYRGGSLLFAVAVAGVVASVVQAERRTWLRAALAVGPLVWIGRISYGLYLWHWPVDVFVNSARTGTSGVSLTLVRLAITFALATASFYVVEMPIRSRRISARVSTVLGPTTAALTAVVVLTTTTASAAVPSYLGGGAAPIAVRPLSRTSAHVASVASKPPLKHGVGAQTNIEIYPCLTPTEQEQSEALDAARASGPPPAEPAGGPVRVLVIGDSVACSVAVGLAPGGAPAIDVDAIAVIGCGIVSDEVWDAHEPFPKSTQDCHSIMAERERAALADFRPQVVLWVSTWERFNLVVNRRVLDTGTAAWRHELDRRLDAAYRVLTAGGAKLLVATIAAPAPAGLLLGERVTSPKFDWKFADMDARLAAFARRHPTGARLVDVAKKLCPDGPPCSADVDGVQPRKLDGAHFDPAGSVWLARWMLPQILAAANRG